MTRERKTRDILVSTGPAETEAAGELLAAELEGGELILLVGELGSGKTTFVRGLARGLGVDDPGGISSPSYTLVNEYPGIPILQHVDLYRLDREEEIVDLAIDELLNPRSVVVVEWGEKLGGLFSNARTIVFEITGENTREIRIAGIEPRSCE